MSDAENDREDAVDFLNSRIGSGRDANTVKTELLLDFFCHQYAQDVLASALDIAECNGKREAIEDEIRAADGVLYDPLKSAQFVEIASAFADQLIGSWDDCGGKVVNCAALAFMQFLVMKSVESVTVEQMTRVTVVDENGDTRATETTGVSSVMNGEGKIVETEVHTEERDGVILSVEQSARFGDLTTGKYDVELCDDEDIKTEAVDESCVETKVLEPLIGFLVVLDG
jgi:hypothetical protein